MESRQLTHSMQPEQACTSGLNAGPDATREIGRLVQQAFHDAEHLYRSASIKRGIAYASLQRAAQNSEGGK